MSDDFYDSGVDDFEGTPGVGTVTYVNEAGVSEGVAEQAVRNSDVASAIERWMRTTTQSGMRSRTFDVFGRQTYTHTDHPFAQMAMCASAVENDDILSTLADTIEGLAFQKMRFEMYDPDQQDLWNQIAADLDLDSRLREMWRELFKVSQVYVGVWWEQRIYKVRTSPIDKLEVPGEEEPRRGGNRTRKKQFAVTVPAELTIFDPTKVLPVGTLMFGRERFAYIATPGEDGAFAEVMSGDVVDETVLRLIERKYTPTPTERQLCHDLEINPEALWLFKPDAVFRHSLTRAHYERFAKVRLKPALEILDLKQHLRQSDRATLVGNTNFIVVIKKGTDRLPAKPAEIENLREQSRVVARMPILVGDHRLSVEIVTPSIDNTLDRYRWQVLDARLVFKALQSFSPTAADANSSAGGSQVSELSRVVARGMESRRHMLGRTLESKLFGATLAKNEGVLDEKPSLAFAPKRIALDFDANIANAVLKLRDRGDISRETTLEEMDYDQDVEYMRRAREHSTYDKIFQSQVPHSSPDSNPFTDGNEGGRPPGVQEEQPRQQQQSS